MRKFWIAALACLALGVTLVVTTLTISSRPASVTADETDGNANLPVVLKPANSPTPTMTMMPLCTPPPCPPGGVYSCPSGNCPGGCGTVCGVPTPYATLTPHPSPTPGFGPNLLANGSFEEGWRDLDAVEGYLINQEPNGWELDWLEKGETVWDLRTIHPEDPTVGVVSGIAEMLHKPANLLPPDEQPGGPKALILQGTHSYKMFHRGAAFGSQLYQQVTLPPGDYRLTVPVQLHWQEKLDASDPTWDTFTAESGAWVQTGFATLGGWATARDMGDRRWYYHVIEFTLPAQTEVGVLIRVKSIYRSPKDFFIDAVWLEKID